MRHYRLGYVRDGEAEWAVQPSSSPRRGDRMTRRPLRLSDDQLNTHVLAAGVTGSGKSCFLRQLLREHRRNGRGCCVIEPGDLIDDFLADCAREAMETGSRAILKKLHLVELSPFQLARYDLFRFCYPKPIHPELRDTVYRSWQHTKVQSVAEIYQWKQGQSTDFEGMPNLQRNFINMFTAVTTLVEDRRLSAADADVLIDLNHPDHERVYLRLVPHLPREIVADFEVLHGYRNVRDLRQETGSFLNRIRATHGPLFKEMIATDGHLPSLNVFRIIQQGGFLLVKTAKSPFASNDQNLALASLFFHDVAETMLVTPREMRRPFTLIVDEAHKLVRPGVGDLARTARKYLLGLVLATTDMTSLRRGELDLAAEILSVFNTMVAFRMTWPEDVNKLVEYLYAQNIDFTELVHEVERRAGHEWLPVNEWSETATQQSGRATMDGTGTMFGTSLQDADGRGDSSSDSASTDPRLPGNRSKANSANQVTTRGRQQSQTRQTSTTQTESESYAVTINHKLVHLERIVREMQKTGSLEQAVADQIARFAQKLSRQPQRQATVRIRERKAIQMETVEVREPFCSPEAQARAVEWIKRELYREHDYYFTPTLDPEEQARRIDEFVTGGQDRNSLRSTSSNVGRNGEHSGPLL